MKDLRKKIDLTMEAIRELDGIKKAAYLLEELTYCSDPYLAASGRICCRAWATLEMYLQLCKELELKVNCIDSYHYEAESERFGVEWVEHDLIISFKEVIKEIVPNGPTYYFTIEENFIIPLKYNIWNAHIIKNNNKFYLKLYDRTKTVDYSVDLKTLRAFEVNERTAQECDSASCSGGRNPAEVKRRLKSKDQYTKNKALIMKPLIEKLYNVEIKED